MSPQEENNLTILLCQYGKENKSFKIAEFYSTVKDIDDQDKRYVENLLLDWGGDPDPNHIISFNTSMNNVQKNNTEKQEYLKKYNVRLLPNALFSYIDHLENC